MIRVSTRYNVGMKRRTYLVMSATLVALFTGGLVWVFVLLVTPTRTAFLVAGGVTLAAGVLGWLVGQHDYSRRWRKVCLVIRVRRELKLEYRAKVPAKELEPFRSLDLFRANRHTAATDWMQGVHHGESVLLFDFIPHGGSQATRIAGQAVVLYPESAGGLPSFHLRPRNVLRDFLGDDISFDADAIEDAEQRKAVERFSRSYVVVSPDEVAVRHYFTANILRILADEPGWMILSDGRHLLLMRPEETALSDRPAYLEKAFALRCALLEAPLESETGNEQPHAGSTEPLIVPGKERGTSYRVAQAVWRVSAAMGGAALLGALIALKFNRRGNLIIAARNGALIGLGIATAVVALLGVFLAGKFLFTYLFSRPQPEQEEFS